MARRVKLNTELVVHTQGGYSAAVIELLGDVRAAMQQIETGQALSNREAKAELRKRFTR